MSHKLLIKTHLDTGLKYLCYTKKEDHNSYLGSGKYWLRHLNTHGKNISTELIFQTEDYDEFKRVSLEKSQEFNIVSSAEWANLMLEGGDGGDTVSSKRWITNGNEDLYINVADSVPDGWRYGRTNCRFNDKDLQKELSSRVDRKKNGEAVQRAWDGSRGDNNVAKRPEVRKKISEAQKKNAKFFSEQAKKTKFWEYSNGRS